MIDGLSLMTNFVVDRPLKPSLLIRALKASFLGALDLNFIEEAEFDYHKWLLIWIEELYRAVMEMEQAKSLQTANMLVQARPTFARALDALRRRPEHEREIAVYEQAFLCPANG